MAIHDLNGEAVYDTQVASGSFVYMPSQRLQNLGDENAPYSFSVGQIGDNHLAGATASLSVA